MTKTTFRHNSRAQSRNCLEYVQMTLPNLFCYDVGPGPVDEKKSTQISEAVTPHSQVARGVLIRGEPQIPVILYKYLYDLCNELSRETFDGHCDELRFKVGEL